MTTSRRVEKALEAPAGRPRLGAGLIEQLHGANVGEAVDQLAADRGAAFAGHHFKTPIQIAQWDVEEAIEEFSSDFS